MTDATMMISNVAYMPTLGIIQSSKKIRYCPSQSSATLGSVDSWLGGLGDMKAYGEMTKIALKGR